MTLQQAKDAPIGSLVLWLPGNGPLYNLWLKIGSDSWVVIDTGSDSYLGTRDGDHVQVTPNCKDVSSDFGLVYDRTQNCMVQAQASQTVTAPTHEQDLNVQDSTHDDTAPRCSGDCYKEYIGQHVPGCAYKAYNDKRNAELLGWRT